MRHLSDLQIGQHGIIVALPSRGAVRNKLIALGLLPGVTVKMLRLAPLGDPMQIQIRGSSLSIRRSDATEVRIKETT